MNKMLETEYSKQTADKHFLFQEKKEKQRIICLKVTIRNITDQLT